MIPESAISTPKEEDEHPCSFTWEATSRIKGVCISYLCTCCYTSPILRKYLYDLIVPDFKLNKNVTAYPQYAAIGLPPMFHHQLKRFFETAAVVIN